MTPRAWVAMGKDETELAARLWAGDVTRALTDREALAPDRVVDLRYEDLVADPWSVVSDVARSVGLPITDAFRRSCETFAIDDRNRSFGSSLTTRQLETITQIAGPAAERIGYTW